MQERCTENLPFDSCHTPVTSVSTASKQLGWGCRQLDMYGAFLIL